MNEILARNPKSREFIFPYVGGEEINNSPSNSAHRFVINFGNMELNEAEQLPELLDIVRAKVFPFRLKTKDTSDGRVFEVHLVAIAA